MQLEGNVGSIYMSVNFKVTITLRYWHDDLVCE
jgi:hypothetical protein